MYTYILGYVKPSLLEVSVPLPSNASRSIISNAKVKVKLSLCLNKHHA
jgi:hypothetical protein